MNPEHTPGKGLRARSRKLAGVRRSDKPIRRCSKAGCRVCALVARNKARRDESVTSPAEVDGEGGLVKRPGEPWRCVKCGQASEDLWNAIYHECPTSPGGQS